MKPCQMLETPVYPAVLVRVITVDRREHGQ